MGPSTVVVTGAGSGIGLAVAGAFAARGARVYGLDLEEGEMSQVATWVECDVSSQDFVDRALADVAARVDAVDVLVNNAGIGAVGTVEEATETEWHDVLNVNVVGIARMTRATLPLLRRSEDAVVVNICSIAATVGLVRRAVYSASKGAVQSLTLAMAADLMGTVRVNCVNPATVDTAWVSRLLERTDDPAAERALLERRQPNGRLVTPNEVAGAVLYLADPAQRSTTGTVLTVDGGMRSVRLPQ